MIGIRVVKQAISVDAAGAKITSTFSFESRRDTVRAKLHDKARLCARL
jgi:hypothetical protein